LDLLEDIERLPINIYRSIGNDLVAEAGKFKVEWKVSLADAFALGLTSLVGGKLVSTDHHEFDVIAESGSIQFYWLR
jgi:predicted nucleic acid-binding protein